jgi:hypothetical protein
VKTKSVKHFLGLVGLLVIAALLSANAFAKGSKVTVNNYVRAETALQFWSYATPPMDTLGELYDNGKPFDVTKQVTPRENLDTLDMPRSISQHR